MEQRKMNQQRKQQRTKKRTEELGVKNQERKRIKERMLRRK